MTPSTIPIALRSDLQVFRATRRIGNDDILTMPSTQFEIIPAPGVGKQINYILGRLTFSSPNYTVYTGLLDGALLSFNLAQYAASVYLPNAGVNKQYLTKLFGTGDYAKPSAVLPPYVDGIVGGFVIPFVLPNDGPIPSGQVSLENLPLMLTLANAGVLDDLVGGDPGVNTLTASVIYNIDDA